ncbi:MAG TPA: hypothetical protein VFB79_07670 [Candidatus Angelobacter sp.]|nr:hypothetical protein [Candidatus Angelobacter sp.]
MARKCVDEKCTAPAFMIVNEMPAMHLAIPKADSEAYTQHNITFTGGTKEIQHSPNEHALQCQCEGCRGHRKRAGMTGVAEPMRRNKRVAKEVRA